MSKSEHGSKAPVKTYTQSSIVEFVTSKTVIVICTIYILLNIVHLLLMLNEARDMKNMNLDVKPIILESSLRPAVEYGAYLKKFNKIYGNQELLRRFEIFKESLKEIQRLNREHSLKPNGAVFGPTYFSDIPKEELFTRVNDDYKSCDEVTKSPKDGRYFDLPLEFNWRDKGFVGPVLDQKYCNGCWAFGIVGVMETLAAKQNNGFLSLSIQELLDCVGKGNGCNGSNVNEDLRWLINGHWPVVTEEEYPLTLRNQSCKINITNSPVGYYLENFEPFCKPSVETILSQIYYHGPVVAVVNADPWLHYLDGIIQMACPSKPHPHRMEHVVQIVGYNRSPGVVPHYIIKNSWGEDFGADGYVKVAMYYVPEQDERDNLCGIRNELYTLYL